MEIALVKEHVLGRPLILFLGVVASMLLWYYMRCQVISRRLQIPNEKEPLPSVPEAYPFQHALGAYLGLPEYLKTLSKRYPNLPGFTMETTFGKFRVIVAPSLASAVLNSPKGAKNLEAKELVFLVYETFLGDYQKTVRNMDQKLFWGPLNKIMLDFMRENFVTTAMQTLSKVLADRIFDLPTDSVPWARNANVKYRDGAYEADLSELLREFVGHVGVDILMGPDFLQNTPTALTDLWAMNDRLNDFLGGTPPWMPRMRKAITGRDRLVRAVRDHHVAYDKLTKGLTPDKQWSRVDEMSNIMKDRIKLFQTTPDFTHENEDERGWLSARADTLVFFALNVNANQLIFWLIFYILSDEALLADVRQEISPFVNIKRDNPNSQSRFEIDASNLQRNCLLLQSALLETLRLETSTTAFRHVQGPFDVSYAAEPIDPTFKKHEPMNIVFNQGDDIVYEHAIAQHDSRYWQNPEVFDARRFLTKGKDGQTRLDYYTLQPWGEGPSMCKGRKFAQGEIMAITAALLTVWDIKPVGGVWKDPGRKRVIASSAHRPKRNLRVMFSRRNLK